MCRWGKGDAIGSTGSFGEGRCIAQHMAKSSELTGLCDRFDRVWMMEKKGKGLGMERERDPNR